MVFAVSEIEIQSKTRPDKARLAFLICFVSVQFTPGIEACQHTGIQENVSLTFRCEITSRSGSIRQSRVR